MLRTAAYARYSSDQQRPTSIDDQLARCAQVAERNGLTISPSLTFSDSAVSGTRSGTEKRAGYRRLVDAIEARECEVVIADEISRLTRHIREGGRLMDLVDEIGIRIITHDGVDTDVKGWKQLWSFKLMQAQSEVETTADRSIRGTYYQLARGLATSPAPFGYDLRPIHDDRGRKVGARLEINESQAALVREIYELRRSGLSLFAVAERLNSRGLVPRRPTRCKRTSQYWRPASLHEMLRNPIYRGIYVYRGSYPCQLRARKRRRTLETTIFERPWCRIVSDDAWFAVNKGSRSSNAGGGQRVPHGSGRHLLAGLVECSQCTCMSAPNQI